MKRNFYQTIVIFPSRIANATARCRTSGKHELLSKVASNRFTFLKTENLNWFLIDAVIRICGPLNTKSKSSLFFVFHGALDWRNKRAIFSSGDVTDGDDRL
jgi:hypothetical protein